jgi:hypothetical protein
MQDDYCSWNNNVTCVVLTPKVPNKNGKFISKYPQTLNSTFLSFRWELKHRSSGIALCVTLEYIWILWIHNNNLRTSSVTKWQHEITYTNLSETKIPEQKCGAIIKQCTNSSWPKMTFWIRVIPVKNVGMKLIIVEIITRKTGIL